MMPRAIDDQDGLLPGEATQEQTEAAAALYHQLGIEPGWVVDEPEWGRDGIPVVTIDWSRLPDVLDYHDADAAPVVTVDWSRRCITVTTEVYDWRRWSRGEPWLAAPVTDRYRDIPGVGAVQEIRHNLATVVASSPRGWSGSLSFDGGLQISEPRGGV